MRYMQCFVLMVSVTLAFGDLEQSGKAGWLKVEDDKNEVQYDTPNFATFTKDLYSSLGSMETNFESEVVKRFQESYLALQGGVHAEQDVYRALYLVYTIRSLEIEISMHHLERFADALQLLSESVQV